jgi:hypothetical protein
MALDHNGIFDNILVKLSELFLQWDREDGYRNAIQNERVVDRRRNDAVHNLDQRCREMARSAKRRDAEKKAASRPVKDPAPGPYDLPPPALRRQR